MMKLYDVRVSFVCFETWIEPLKRSVTSEQGCGERFTKSSYKYLYVKIQSPAIFLVTVRTIKLTLLVSIRVNKINEKSSLTVDEEVNLLYHHWIYRFRCRWPQTSSIKSIHHVACNKTCTVSSWQKLTHCENVMPGMYCCCYCSMNELKSKWLFKRFKHSHV